MGLSPLVTILCVASLIGGLNGQEVYKRQGPIDVEPTVFFNTIRNLTACSSAEFTWFYNGPQDITMSLLVTNIDVPRPSATTPTVNVTIGTEVIPRSILFKWDVVNIPPGNYRLVASIPSRDFRQESAIFHVVAGTDSSCLGESSPSPSLPVSSGTQTPPSSTAPSSTNAPVGGVVKPRVNTGTIIGIVLGVVALLIISVALFFWVQRRRPKSGKARKWNGLSSTDSRNPLTRGYGVGGFTADPSQSRRSRQLSLEQRRNYDNAAMARSDDGLNGGGSEEKVGGRSGRKDSTATTYDDHDTPMALSHLPTLHRDAGRNNEADKHGRRPSFSEASPAGRSGGRERSGSKAQYPPHYQGNESAVSRTSSQGTTSVAHHTTEVTSPSNADAKKAHRNSIGGRKRKPVPTYDPNELANLPSPGVSPSSPTLSPSPFSASPLQSVLDHESTTHGHYSTRNQPSRPGTADGGELLSHKTSFGAGGVEGKPLHYLIPDMPPDSSSRR